MTRTAADAGLLMSVLAGPDVRDHLSLPPADIAWQELEIDLTGRRIGVQLDAGIGLAVEPDIRAAVIEAARLFEAAGAVVEPVEPFLRRETLDGLDRFWRVRAWSDMVKLPGDRRELVLPYIAEWAAAGASLSGLEVYRGFAQIDVMGVDTLRATEPFDFVLSPVCPVSAPAADRASPTNDPRRPFEHITFTVPYNMSGQPAVSVNCGYTAAFERLRPVQRPAPQTV
jgi:aspartyl-tRNA(Asn)/glutamyl-tRNA(Gln) amidotransferase subunit A